MILLRSPASYEDDDLGCARSSQVCIMYTNVDQVFYYLVDTVTVGFPRGYHQPRFWVGLTEALCLISLLVEVHRLFEAKVYAEGFGLIVLFRIQCPCFSLLLCLILCTSVMNYDVSVLLAQLCICIFKTCDLRQMCTLILKLIVILYCSINVSSIRFDAHVEYSKLFQYGCYNISCENKLSQDTYLQDK